MQLSSAPIQIQLPFGNGDGSKTNPIPVPSQIPITPGAASFTDGFPPLNATPVTSGGIPPSKADMNGVLFMLSGVDSWMSAGAGFQFNSGFATAIGGYPKGARVLNAAANGYWLSIIDNNSNDPDTGGAGWIPSNMRAVAGVNSSATRTLAVGNSKIIWDTVEFDSLGLWDGTDERFVAKWAGIYRLSGSITLLAPAGQNLGTLVFKNGSAVKTSFEFPQTSNVNLTLPFDVMISCAVGDYLEAFLNVTQANVSTDFTFGQIEYLGT